MKQVITNPILKSLNKAILFLSFVLLTSSAFAQNTQCNAQFTFKADTVNSYTIHFTSSTANPSGTKYYWSFGDQTSQSTDPNPSHTYSHTGGYWVCLYVIDSAVGGGDCYFSGRVHLKTKKTLSFKFNSGTATK